MEIKNKKQNGSFGKGKGYAGKISNSGAQVVEPIFQKTVTVNPKVKEGGDLRSGKNTNAYQAKKK